MNITDVLKSTVIKTIAASLLMMLAQMAVAETTVYSIRVDGLACPYCAYGIEKKLDAIKGIKFIDMDLENGVVTAEANDVKLSDVQLQKLFEDSGFTYRSKKVVVQ